MALYFLYLALATTLRLLGRRRSNLARDAEILLLRHELAVLRRPLHGHGWLGRIGRWWPRSHGSFQPSAAMA